MRYGFLVTLGFTASLAVACGGGENREAAQQPNTPPGAQTSPSAERRMITLTGCLQRQAPGSADFVLASVATGGAVGTTGQEKQDDRSYTAEPGETPDSQARLAAGTSYRLVPTPEQDLAEYENHRVTIVGMLAAPTPQAGSSDLPRTGAPVESSPTGTTVAGDAPPLRGLHVESVRNVSDSCS